LEKGDIGVYIQEHDEGLPEVVGWRLHVINQQTKEVRRMNRHTIPLGRILGIPIGLDYSWFLIFVLITWTMAVGYYPAEFKNWPVAQYWFVGAMTAIMLFVSVLLHELGHSVVAMRYKVPVRSITLYIFGGISLIGTVPPTAAAGFWIAIADLFFYESPSRSNSNLLLGVKVDEGDITFQREINQIEEV
jgi:hypothetical protein